MRAKIASARWWIGIGAAAVASALFYSTLILGGPLDHRDWSGHHYHYFDWVRISLVDYGTLPLYMADAKMSKNFIANAESPTLGPFVWLLPALPTDAYIKLLLVLFSAAGCVGMFTLLRDLAVGPAIAAPLAIAFAFNGFFSAHIAAGHHWAMGAQLLPLLVLLLRRAASGSRGAIPLAAAINAFTILGGQHQPFIWQNLVLGAYAALLALQRRTVSPLVSLVAIVAWSAGLAAVKLLPMVIEFADYDPTAHTVGLPAGALWQAFFARGQSPESEIAGLAFTSGAGWWEYAFYAGPLLAVCAVAALASIRRTWPLVAIGAFFTWIALDGAGGAIAWERLSELPVWRTQRSPSRFLFIATFCALAAGGVGLQRGFERAGPRARRALVWLCCAAALLAFLDLRHESQPWQAASIGDPIESRTHHPRRRRPPEPSHADAVLESFAPNAMEFRVVARAPSRAVLPVRFAKGARAAQRRGEDPGVPEWQVEGFEPVADDGKLAVDVPAGEHVVTIRYRPRGFRAGLGISLASCVFLGLLALRRRILPQADPESGRYPPDARDRTGA
jgi:hypothetical protein